MKYLVDNVSAEEEKNLLEWIAKHPDNAVKFEESKRLMLYPGRANIGFNPDVDDAWMNLKAKIEYNGAQKRTNKLVWLKMAAAVALLVGMAYVFAVLLTKNQPSKIMTNFSPSPEVAEKLIEIKSTGKLKFVYLPDSSLVFLNKNSKISYAESYNSEDRIVYLEGESFFDVKRDPDRPFVVYAGMTKTRVLGTSFNIEAYEHQEGVEITVASGKVVFFLKGTSKDRMMVLESDDKLVFKKNDISVKKTKNSNQDYLAWINEDANDDKKDKELMEDDDPVLNSTNRHKYASEIAQPTAYLNNVSKWTNTFIWKNRLIKKTLIEGEIYNSATIAIFKDIRLTATFYNKNHAVIDTRSFIVHESVGPGQVITYKRKLDNWHDDAITVIVEIEEAGIKENEQKPPLKQ